MDVPVSLDVALGTFDEQWAPRTVARVNDYDVRLAKVDGAFVWHSHPETDELFLVLSGRLTILLDGRDPVTLGPRDVFVVPRGLRHCPTADGETAIMLLEPTSVVNTGDAGGDRTAVPVDLTG